MNLLKHGKRNYRNFSCHLKLTQGDGSFVLICILPYGKIKIYGGVKCQEKHGRKAAPEFIMLC